MILATCHRFVRIAVSALLVAWFAPARAEIQTGVILADPVLAFFIAANPITNRVYVTTSGGLTVADGVTNLVIAQIPLSSAGPVAVDEVANRIYVGDGFGNVTVVDGATNAFSTVAIGSIPQAIAVDTATGEAYVVDSGLTVIDGSTHSTSTVPVGSSPVAVAVDAVTNKVYVANSGGNSVTVVDGATKATTDVPLPASPQAVAVNPVTGKVYVAEVGGITVIDEATLATTTVSAGTIAGPMGIAVNTVTNRIYLGDGLSRGLLVMDGASNVLTSIPGAAVGTAGNAPHLVINEAANVIYAPGAGPPYGIYAVDGATNAVHEFSASPVLQNLDLALNPATGTLYNTRTLVGGVAVFGLDPRLGNLSTRTQVLTGDDVMIGGFVIGGTSSKTVVVRARGPSLAPYGITGALANPTLTLVRSSDQTVLATNDDWQSAPNATAIGASGFAPSDPLESAIMLTLPPGAYTAIESGIGGSTGVGIVEVFEVSSPSVPLVNLSTRAQVLTGNDVMIGGFVVQGSGPQKVVIRARGPSLAAAGIANPLHDPTLTLVRSSDQAVIATNDNWGSSPDASAIALAGFAPSDGLESAILATLQPGAYTAIVSGVGGATGTAIVEVFTTP